MTSVSLNAFRAKSLGRTLEVKHHTILPDTDSPGVAITALFPFQSYFDSTLLETALLIQSTNQPIIDSTLKKMQIGGYSFGLHPSSQTPVAVQPIVGGQSASPQAIVLHPGQIYRPHGRTDGRAGQFSGFNWGLPFGWLGGGMATLYVFPSSDADVAWPGDSEVIFHRQRMQIVAPGFLPANAPKNWPLRFPWTQALRGAASIPQQGAAVISIAEPTRVMMSLRMPSLGTASDMRMIIQESNDFDLDSAGAVIAGLGRFDTYTWGTYAANGGAGNLATNYPVVQYDGPLVRLAADDGGVTLVDMSAGGDLTEEYVDVVRYGKL